MRMRKLDWGRLGDARRRAVDRPIACSIESDGDVDMSVPEVPSASPSPSPSPPPFGYSEELPNEVRSTNPRPLHEP